MSKKHLALGMAVVLLVTGIPIKTYASEMTDEVLSEQIMETESAEESPLEQQKEISASMLATEDTMLAATGSGTYIPYEGAKYSLKYSVTEGGISIDGIADYASKDDLGQLVIPAEIDGVPVTSIGGGAFYDCSGLTGDLIIPDGVTVIGSYAFSGCSGFTGNLIIPGSVTTIKDYTFSSCSGFTGDLIIPECVTGIGYMAFLGCSGLTGNLIILSSVTTLDDYAFYGCSGFTGDLIIPDGVTDIGYSVFEYCSGFTGNLIIPDGVTDIGVNAFFGCSGLTGDLSIPDSVTSIGNSAFYGCSGLTGDLSIPEGVTSIGNNAFFGCSGLTGDLSIPEGVTSIGNNAFYGCSNLHNIHIGAGVQRIEKNVFPTYSKRLQAITVLGRDTVIDDDALGTQKLIYGYTGSTAEAYAQTHSCTFIALDDAAEQNKEVIVNVPDLDLIVGVSMTNTEREELISHVLTDEEAQSVEAGQKAVMEVSVVNAENTLTDADRQIIDAKASAVKATIVQYLDITMSIQVGDNGKRNVTQTDKPVRLVIEVPQQFLETDRVFSVARLHDGVVELLEDLDTNPFTVTIETDRFSSYTLVYKGLQDGYDVSGTVTSFGDASAQTLIQLKDSSGTVISETAVAGNSTEYMLADIPQGTYTLYVSKQNHVSREYTLIVGEEAVTQNVELLLSGDVNGDGRINARDQKIIYNHIAGITLMEDYVLAVADVYGDGKVNARDQKIMYNHIAGISLLW